MDVHPNGRGILLRYIKSIQYGEKGIDLQKTYDSVFSFMGSREAISIRDLENSYHSWIQGLTYPSGYDSFLKLQNYNVFSSRLQLLNSILDTNKSFALYYDTISEEFLNSGDDKNALNYAEMAIEKNLRMAGAVQKAVYSSYKLGDFPKAEYYFGIAKELKLSLRESTKIESSIFAWRKQNPSLPEFLPEVRFPNFE